MKKWKIEKEFRIQNSEFRIRALLKILLGNRGIVEKKEREGFLHPKLEDVTVEKVGIDKREVERASKRITRAIKNKEQIIVYGDYDVDGICGAAILWETLYEHGAAVTPYIPHRVDEGYGLSVIGIKNLPAGKAGHESRIKDIKLIITVDNGIVANEAVAYAKKQGIDVIITDHHTIGKELPKAYAIVHTTKLCGAGVAYLLSQSIYNSSVISNTREKSQGNDSLRDDHLAFAALATIADLVPLIGPNRALTKFGLEKLKTTQRVGLVELYKEAALDPASIDVYAVGHMIAPRLNAMGRLETAMDSLRLLCTNNRERARSLAVKLGQTNRERQLLTQETVLDAKSTIQNSEFRIQNLLFIAHESYQQGVIGLVAGKLVEEFYRPSIVLSIGEKYSKASARSISGFNIIEFIRMAGEHLVDAGGHPMAAGFTVETSKVHIVQQRLEKLAEEMITKEQLTRVLRIDCELPLSVIDISIYDAIQQLAPFGMGNPEPTFVSRGVIIEDMRLVGAEGRHLRLNLKSQMSNVKFNAIAFGMGERSSEFHIGDTVAIAYTLDEDSWYNQRNSRNGEKKIQLVIKDVKSVR